MNEPAQPWLDSAHRSLVAAEALFSASLWPITCFEAQQCVELMLKAAIVHGGTVPPRVHSLPDLADRLPSDLRILLKDTGPALYALNTYYSSTRYPDAVSGGLPEREDAEAALAIARRVVQTIEQALDGEDSDKVPDKPN